MLIAPLLFENEVSSTAIGTTTRAVDGYVVRNVVSREDNDSLVRHLALLFTVTAETISEQDLNHLDQLMLRLNETAQLDTRCYVAVQISISRRPPQDTLRLLANDQILVARPILIHSPALSDEDLNAIALGKGVSHMSAIAERSELSINVTDVLVSSGDDAVRRIVTSNFGAKLSDISFRILTRQAQHDSDLESVLMAREDVPRIIVRFLVRNGSGPAKRQAKGFMIEDADSTRRNIGHLWYQLYDFDAAEARLMTLADEGRRGLQLLMRSIVEERFPEAILMLSYMSGASPEDLLADLARGDVIRVVAAAHLIQLPTQSLVGLLRIGPWRLTLCGKERKAAVNMLEKMTQKDAENIIARSAEPVKIGRRQINSVFSQ